MDGREARAALAAAGETRARLATETHWPAWRHAGFGAVMAAMVGGLGLPTGAQMGTMLLGLAGTAWLVRYDRETAGFWVNGYRRGRTLWVTLALVVVLLALVVLNLGVRFGSGPGWATAGIALAAFAAATAAGVAWWRVYVAEARA